MKKNQGQISTITEEEKDQLLSHVLLLPRCFPTVYPSTSNTLTRCKSKNTGEGKGRRNIQILGMPLQEDWSFHSSLARRKST